jgi:hypothetical protein
LAARAWLQLEITETTVVEKPADEDEHGHGHHHGHAHQNPLYTKHPRHAGAVSGGRCNTAGY